MIEAKIERIEIRQQPERRRYWAEIELFDSNRNLRATTLTAPGEDGLDGIQRAVNEWCSQWGPKPKEKPAPEPRWDWRADPRSDKVRAATGPGETAYRETLIDAGFSDDEIAAIEHDTTIWHRREYDDPNFPKFEFPTRSAGAADIDTLRAEAEAAGVRVDKRWGEARLREEIASAGRENAPEERTQMNAWTTERYSESAS